MYCLLSVGVEFESQGMLSAMRSHLLSETRGRFVPGGGCRRMERVFLMVSEPRHQTKNEESGTQPLQALLLDLLCGCWGISVLCCFR